MARQHDPHAKPLQETVGLQKDGDLCEQVWKVVKKQGAANQDLRKAKGHATAADVKQGRSNARDKKGDDISDTNVDKGVEMIRGKERTRQARNVGSQEA